MTSARVPRRWRQVRAAVLLNEGYRCWLCGEATPPADSVDHVVPWSKGGTHSVANLRAAHMQCNRRKGADQVLPAPNPTRRWRVAMR